MNRILTAALFLLSTLTVGYSQVASVAQEAQEYREAIGQDPQRTAGTFYVYDGADLPAMIPAPKGYKPFYISHFARHGARYCTSEYDTFYGWMKKASEAGALSDGGKEFFSRYESFYEKVRLRKGNLTALGKEQHRQIARRMYSRFPAVFKGPTRIEAFSTESPRVIMSMWSCLSRLDELDSDAEVFADASAQYASWLQPPLSSNPYYAKGRFDADGETLAAHAAWFEDRVPWKNIAKRFFSSENVLREVLGVTPLRFIEILHAVVTGTYCLDEDRGSFDDVFSDEELYQIWEGLSARYFLSVARFGESKGLAADYGAYVLEEIIASADEDIYSGDTRLRLRFSHDSSIAPLIVFMDLDGAGKVAGSFDETLRIFPSYRLPMASSVQLVLFRKKGGKMLVKVLLNEREATLPFPAADGPYYLWDDFKAYYAPRIAASRSKIESAL